jgi:diguanylate cyclase (GGDEF)-like protein
MDKPPLRILLVDDDPASLALLGQPLRALGHEVREARSARQGWHCYQAHHPQVILLKRSLADDSLGLVRQVREHEGRHWTPIIFLTPTAPDKVLADGIDAGGDDYLITPLATTCLVAKVQAVARLIDARDELGRAKEELSKLNEQLRHKSLHDELTGLSNRRGFDEQVQNYLAQARRDQRPLTLILCDVDFFKRYNDRLGHSEGDACLRHVASLLTQVCRRPLDHAARYGGEAFALLLPNTPVEGALNFAMALQHALDRDGLFHPDSAVARHVTLSGGFATMIPDGDTTAELLIVKAEMALHEAKARGRYRFVNLDADMDTGVSRHSTRHEPLHLAASSRVG